MATIRCPQCSAAFEPQEGLCPSCGWTPTAGGGDEPRQEYRDAQEAARRIATEVGAPRFYTEHAEAVAESTQLFAEDPLVRDALAALVADKDTIGHGLNHITKVAVDAGAIVLVERGDSTPLGPGHGTAFRLVSVAHVAGVLHDIKRGEHDHARRGAEEAGRILRSFNIREDERLAIVDAIASHEAFQSAIPEANSDWQLLSDALYDADKFRWGPDNFSEMLWDMVARFDVPLSTVLDGFLEGMEGVAKIRETFRSETGRRYGPDFIDCGMEIGRRLYAELTEEEH